MDGNKGVIHFKDWDNSYIPNILRELYLDRVYAPYLHGKENLTIIDAGFNIGLFSLYASKYAKQIYAFEPSKETYDIGTLNLRDNNITNVKLFQKAIHTKDEKIHFYHNQNSTMNSTMAVVENLPKIKETVQGIRFDTFVKEEKIEKIDFLKLDIEGSECAVIGSESFQKVVPILEALVVEYHSWSGVSPQQLVTTLRDYGYLVEQIPSEATILSAVKP
jgi:FkbM family methyltransferase